MKLFLWALVLAGIAVLGYALSSYRRRRAELQRASDARMSALLAEVQKKHRATARAPDTSDPG